MPHLWNLIIGLAEARFFHSPIQRKLLHRDVTQEIHLTNTCSSLKEKLNLIKKECCCEHTAHTLRENRLFDDFRLRKCLIHRTWRTGQVTATLGKCCPSVLLQQLLFKLYLSNSQNQLRTYAFFGQEIHQFLLDKRCRAHVWFFLPSVLIYLCLES